MFDIMFDINFGIALDFSIPTGDRPCVGHYELSSPYQADDDSTTRTLEVN